MDSDDAIRSGSADSENSSDNSYVQVTQEEATLASQEATEGGEATTSFPKTPAVDDEEDIYGAEEDEEPPQEESAPLEQEQPPPKPEEEPPSTSDPYFMESPEPEEYDSPKPEEYDSPKPEEEPSEETTPPQPHPTTGVEDVPPERQITSGTKSTKTLSIEAKGYLSFLNFLHPVVLYVIYWRDMKLSAVILGVCLVILLTLTLNTFLHTIILLLLSFMVVSLSYIVTKISVDSFYNREVKNPFSDYLNRKITLPEREILQWCEYLVTKMDCYYHRLVRLLLFDNIKASLKFGILLWLLSFVTNWFTVLTTIFLLVAVSFSIPVAYDRFQSKVDPHIEWATKRAEEIYNKVKGLIPFLGKSKVE